MPGVKGRKWSDDARAAFLKRTGKKKEDVGHIKTTAAGNVPASAPPTVPPDSPDAFGALPGAKDAPAPPKEEAKVPIETDKTGTGAEGKDISKERKAKTVAKGAPVDLQAVMEMAPGLVKLASDGMGTVIEIVSNVEAVPYKATYTPVTDEMAAAFCKANKVTLERYLPGWYQNSPIIMLALSFGAMQMASIEWQKKPKYVEPLPPQVIYNNRAAEPVIVRQPVPEVQNLPNPTAATGGVQHGV